MKDEELWNKMLLVVEVGDKVRFKYGKVTWEVLTIGTVAGKQWIRVRRFCVHISDLTHRMWSETFVKEVWQGTEEYRNIRIVKPHE